MGTKGSTGFIQEATVLAPGQIAERSSLEVASVAGTQDVAVTKTYFEVAQKVAGMMMLKSGLEIGALAAAKKSMGNSINSTLTFHQRL